MINDILSFGLNSSPPNIYIVTKARIIPDQIPIVEVVRATGTLTWIVYVFLDR